MAINRWNWDSRANPWDPNTLDVLTQLSINKRIKKVLGSIASDSIVSTLEANGVSTAQANDFLTLFNAAASGDYVANRALMTGETHLEGQYRCVTCTKSTIGGASTTNYADRLSVQSPVSVGGSEVILSAVG